MRKTFHEEKTLNGYRGRMQNLFRRGFYAMALLLPLLVAACSKGGSGY